MTAATRVVRHAVPGDADACVSIVEGLSEYFTPDVPDKVRHDLAAHGGWVAVDDGTVVGLCVVERRGDAAAELLWAAVLADRRHGGVGTALVARVLDALADDGVQVVEVKTLDATAGYAPYEATRAFWSSCGFVQVDTIDPLPGWQPGNPAAILVASLAVTRRP